MWHGLFQRPQPARYHAFRACRQKWRSRWYYGHSKAYRPIGGKHTCCILPDYVFPLRLALCFVVRHSLFFTRCADWRLAANKRKSQKIIKSVHYFLAVLIRPVFSAIQATARRPHGLNRSGNKAVSIFYSQPFEKRVSRRSTSRINFAVVSSESW